MNALSAVLSWNGGVCGYYRHTHDVLATTPPHSGFHVFPACTCPAWITQPVMPDSPLTHRIMGSVGLCKTEGFIVTVNYCKQMIYKWYTNDIHTYRFYAGILCMIMWILCMHVCKHFNDITVFAAMYTIQPRHCIPQCNARLDLPFPVWQMNCEWCHLLFE